MGVCHRDAYHQRYNFALLGTRQSITARSRFLPLRGWLGVWRDGLRALQLFTHTYFIGDHRCLARSSYISVGSRVFIFRGVHTFQLVRFCLF